MSEEKKIIIDEDWKSQVEAEKEAAEKPPQEEPAGHEQGFPEASFELLVSTFTTEAMVALGQFPNPMDNTLQLNLEHAKYAIDMLQMIEEKTKGNLSDPEAGMIESILHQLRMAFVAIQTGGVTPPPDAPTGA